MKSILIAGGSGLIGSRLTKLLTYKGQQVKILTRSDRTSDNEKVSYHQWDLKSQTADPEAFDCDVIINLTGAGIADQRWSEERKKVIIESRVNSVKLIGKMIAQLNDKPSYIGASAVGIYGDSEKTMLQESEISDDKDFMVEVCKLWEEAHESISSLVDSLSLVRIGIVLSMKGGALKEMLKPLQLARQGVYFGNGKMIYSWIHIDDMCHILADLASGKIPAGLYNAVAPHPSTNKEIIESMIDVRGKFAVKIPAPEFTLKLALGEMSSTILNSTSVSSEKIAKAGYQFKYPTITKALTHIFDTSV